MFYDFHENLPELVLRVLSRKAWKIPWNGTYYDNIVFLLLNAFFYSFHTYCLQRLQCIYIKLVLMRGQTHPLVVFIRAAFACGSANQLLMTSAVTGSVLLGPYVKIARAYYKLY